MSCANCEHCRERELQHAGEILGAWSGLKVFVQPVGPNIPDPARRLHGSISFREPSGRVLWFNLSERGVIDKIGLVGDFVVTGVSVPRVL